MDEIGKKDVRVFVYEHVATLSQHSMSDLEPEARAMHEALVEDFAAIPELRVTTILNSDRQRSFSKLVDVRRCQAVDERSLREIAGECDVAMVIAPESGQVLSKVCETISRSGWPIFGPMLEWVEVFSDKRKTAAHLDELGIETSVDFSTFEDQTKVVVKPFDGVGCHCVALCPPEMVQDAVRSIREQGCHDSLIVQPYRSGTPASVALICSKSAIDVLPAVEQRIALTDDDRVAGLRWLSYLGGRMPLSVELNFRAIRLAERFAERTPDLLGYIGLDLILGDDSNGQDDRIVEVNPRLTTSYLGYRQFIPLAAHFLAAMKDPGSSTTKGLPIIRNRVRQIAPDEKQSLAAKSSTFGTLQFDASGQLEWKNPLES